MERESELLWGWWHDSPVRSSRYTRESHYPHRSHPCRSAALLHCSKAASSLRFALIGSGDFGVNSPISTLAASLVLSLGELSTAGAAVAPEGCAAMAETEARRV